MTTPGAQQALAEHIRTIAQAAGWSAQSIKDICGVYVQVPNGQWLDSELDEILIAAHAVAWSAGKGYEFQNDGDHVSVAGDDGIRCPWLQHDPTDPHSTARATLAAVAEVVGMLNQGGE